MWVSWCKNKSFWQRFTCTTLETIEDQISETNATINELKETVQEDDIEIRKLIKNQQDTFENHVNDEFSDLKEKVEDRGLKDTDLESAFDDLKVVYEEEHTNLKKLIKEQSELTGKSLSEALLFAWGEHVVYKNSSECQK